MLRDSLDGLRDLLNGTFPSVGQIYLNTVPDRFKRPSFFIALVSNPEDALNKAMYQARATWQIVYFAPLDGSGFPEKFNQFSVSDTLKEKLMQDMVVTGPGGTVYHIRDVDGGPRDNEVYITVQLETEKTRPVPEYELMQDVEHEFKGE